MQFTTYEFIDPVVALKKDEVYKYPANAYSSVYRVRIQVEEVTKRKFVDRALNKHNRLIIRIK